MSHSIMKLEKGGFIANFVCIKEGIMTKKLIRKLINFILVLTLLLPSLSFIACKEETEYYIKMDFKSENVGISTYSATLSEENSVVEHVMGVYPYNSLYITATVNFFRKTGDKTEKVYGFDAHVVDELYREYEYQYKIEYYLINESQDITLVDFSSITRTASENTPYAQAYAFLQETSDVHYLKYSFPAVEKYGIKEQVFEIYLKTTPDERRGTVDIILKDEGYSVYSIEHKGQPLNVYAIELSKLSYGAPTFIIKDNYDGLTIGYIPYNVSKHFIYDCSLTNVIEGTAIRGYKLTEKGFYSYNIYFYGDLLNYQAMSKKFYFLIY